jgi:hypothetical protein
MRFGRERRKRRDRGESSEKNVDSTGEEEKGECYIPITSRSLISLFLI